MSSGAGDDGGMVWPLGGEPKASRSRPDPFGPNEEAAAGVEESKPWVALLDGETRTQWQVRMSNTCQQCGHYEEDSRVLSRHEEMEHGDG